MIIMVVMGKYILKLGLSMKTSPGRRPMGNFPSHGHNSPTARNITPNKINVFCMTIYTKNGRNLLLALGQFLQQPRDHIPVRLFTEMFHYGGHRLHGSLEFRKIYIFIDPGHDFIPAHHFRQV